VLNLDGSCLQPGLEHREENLFPEREVSGPRLAIISKVFYADDASNKLGQTLVDVQFPDGCPPLPKIPVLRRKASLNGNGEDWSPEEGDQVVVNFLSGNYRDAYVEGYLPFNRNTFDAKQAEHPSDFLRENGWEEERDKDGNLTWRHPSGTYFRVAPTKTLPTRMGSPPITAAASVYLRHSTGTEIEVTPAGDIIINGIRDAQVTLARDATLSVAGNVNATVSGNATVQVDGQTLLTCPDVRLGDSAGKKIALEDHVHTGVQAGSDTTGPPTSAGLTTKTKAS
jgi:phage baseplate assembly protein gpV